MDSKDYSIKSRGLSLFSGGLDSQLAVKVLQSAGAYVECVTFTTPFFSPASAGKAAEALGVKLHVVDFTNDEVDLIENPPHGFGSAMNPCIDCHAKMISRAGELMESLGFDFVATGEVLNQRPMSQNKQSLGVVEKASGLTGRLVRPLSAQLLEPTIPEKEGILDRSKLLGISGRQRLIQMELAEKFGISEYPSAGGGCKLTEKGFARRLQDLLDHEGLRERRLLELLNHARRFRLPDGSGVILGRDGRENAILKSAAVGSDVVVTPVSVPGPTAVVPALKSDSDLSLVKRIVCAWSRFDQFHGEIIVKIVHNGTQEDSAVPRPYERAPLQKFQIT